MCLALVKNRPFPTYSPNYAGVDKPIPLQHYLNLSSIVLLAMMGIIYKDAEKKTFILQKAKETCVFIKMIWNHDNCVC